MTIHIQPFSHAPFWVNSYVVWDDESRDAVLVNTCRNMAPVIEFIEANDFNFDSVLHTHAFIEFLEGQPELRQHFDFYAHMNPLDEFWLAHLDTQATILNVESGAPQAFVDQQVLGGDTVVAGSLKFDVLHTPGHSPGGTSYYLPAAKALFCGDVLYRQAMAAVDIPHANERQLRQTINDILFNLPDDTILYPGRGPITTLGDEKTYSQNNTHQPIIYGRSTDAAWCAVPEVVV